MSVRVSVVVPTYRRPELLRDCLDALLNQDFPANEYEIIVADNAGDERTRSLVERMSRAGRPTSGSDASPAVLYLQAAAKPGPAAARNLAWRAAHGDLIAFTDDDCRPQRTWLREGTAALDRGFDAVTGRMVVPVGEPPSDYERNISRLATDAEFLTANLFARCGALSACGGFDERFTAAWREDSDLHFNLVSRSFRLGAAPSAVVVHPVRPAPWGVSLHEQRKSMFNALLYKKHPEHYRERIQKRPPYQYYAIVLLALACLAGFISGHAGLALVTAALWLVLTLEFAFERLRGTRHDASHVLEMLVTSALIPPLSVFWRLSGAIRYGVWFL